MVRLPAGIDELRNALISTTGYDPGDFGDKISSLDDNKILAKLDWNINNTNKLSVRHSYSDSENIDAFRSRATSAQLRQQLRVLPKHDELNSTRTEQHVWHQLRQQTAHRVHQS